MQKEGESTHYNADAGTIEMPNSRFSELPENCDPTYLIPAKLTTSCEGREHSSSKIPSSILTGREENDGAKVIFQDRSQQKDLGKKESLLDFIISHSDNAIICETIEGIITRWNEGAVKIYGYAASEIVGRHNSVLACEENREERKENLQILLRGNPVTLETCRKRKDGSLFSVELDNFPIKNASGELICICQITHVISDTLPTKEKWLADHKLDVLNTITHQDIKNKVTALRGYILLGRNSDEAEERDAFLNKMDDVLKTMQKVIENTEEYQQIKCDSPDWIPVDLTVLMQWSALSQKGKILLKRDLGRLEILADPLFARVIYHLMKNAIRHGETVTQIRFSYKEARDGILLLLEDNGIGIPFDQKLQIFDRVIGGDGKFGLFFVREYLSLFCMTISEKGEPGKGARFEIFIPKGAYRFASRG